MANNIQQQIEKAAIKIISQKGFNGTGLREIADSANVSIKTIYRYYPSKQKLLHHMLEKVWLRLNDGMNAVKHDLKLDPLEKIDAVVELITSTIAENPKMGILFFDEDQTRHQKGAIRDHYASLVKSFESIFDQGLAENFINEAVNRKTFIYFIIGGIKNTMNAWTRNPKKKLLPAIKESLKFQIKHGILKW